MKIKFYPVDSKRNKKLKYVIIGARFEFKTWTFVKHKKRDTWELPAGHIEPNESPDNAAKRELYEETGAICYSIIPLFDYSVTQKISKKYGRVYFAEIDKIGELPKFEIGEISFNDKLPNSLTYSTIQPLIFEQIQKKVTAL